MNEIDDGGPAFPQNDAVVNRINNEAGMSLRDYFAGQVVIGILSFDPSYPVGQASANAYRMADAMLKARGER